MLSSSIARTRGLVLVLAIGVGSSALSQETLAPTARQSAPYDLTGYWVSIVTEDWRWRMMTAPRGDYASVPLTAAGRVVADSWDLEADILNDNECRPYGAGGIMRVPGRLHITWEDDETLRVDTDAGSQTRRFHFGDFEPASAPTWQGNSVATWEFTGGGRNRAPTGGALKVVTTGMKLGYLRWNGVPYSEEAVITEYFDRHAAFGQEWFTVTTIIDDPRYLSERFIVSTDFRREDDDSGWNPTACVTEPPVIDEPVVGAN